MRKQITLNYGALSDEIEEQLNKQGFTLGDKKDFIHKLDNALSMCMFHLLTDAQYRSGMKKLHKKVMDSIKPLEMEVQNDYRTND